MTVQFFSGSAKLGEQAEEVPRLVALQESASYSDLLTLQHLHEADLLLLAELDEFGLRTKRLDSLAGK